jgi:hypothetical protein
MKKLIAMSTVSEQNVASSATKTVHAFLLFSTDQMQSIVGEASSRPEQVSSRPHQESIKTAPHLIWINPMCTRDVDSFLMADDFFSTAPCC